jgi:nitroreductase
MSEFMDIITGRRSIRSYTDQAVSGEDLDIILEAARWAPSWANTQCWEIVLVRDGGRKKALQDILGRNPAHNAIVDADLVLVVVGKKGRAGFKKEGPTTRYGDWMMFDLGIVTQNICLAAHALDLGTVIVGSFDHDAVEEVLDIPDAHAVAVMIPLGHPAEPARTPPRRKITDWTHGEKFGS